MCVSVGVGVCVVCGVVCNGVCLRLGDMLYVLCVLQTKQKGKGVGEGSRGRRKVYKVNRKRKKRNTKRGKQRKLS